MEQKPKVVLSDMDLDEVSSVILGDNPGADILIYKGMPTQGSVHHDRPLDAMDFRYSKKLKRRKKKDRMKKRADEALGEMSRAAEAHVARRRIRG